jgi:TctA family transporter
LDIAHHLLLGFHTVLSAQNLFYCFVGALLGTLIGVLPGIGPVATVALLLPITISLSPTAALIMLAGIYYGAQYGGSTTAILMNLPGESSSAVTAIDGYRMARNGRAGAALSIAAVGSFFAGSVATLIIALFAPPLTGFALDFGSTEYCALIVLGLVASVALAHGSILRALAMIICGLLLGTVGTDMYTGTMRFNFGIADLSDGIDFTAVAVGLFGVAEILRNLEAEKSRTVTTQPVNSLWPTREETRRSVGPILRGTALGSVLGILPGGGGVLASFLSYTLEKRVSKRPGQFGSGAVEGVAGPESANNAAAQTSFIPMLTLGIPSNAVMAVMVGAMVLQGITPGPRVIVDQPELFWGLVASMWIGNVMLVILNLPLVGIWVALLRIPYHVLIPAILVFSAIGIYSLNSNPFGIYEIAFFGVLGYLLEKLGCEPAPLLLGFILGPLFEEHFRRAMLLGRGDPMIFIHSPISAVLLAISLLALILVLLPSLGRKRDVVFVEGDT